MVHTPPERVVFLGDNMKVLFTADLHIKLGQKKVPREWQKNRYISLFDKIEKLQEEVDLIVLGGDIFDKVPNMEELELYFNLITRLTKRTIIFDGNHEATRKGKTFLLFLEGVTCNLNNKVEILDGYYSIDNMDFIPYTHIKLFNPNDFSGNILFTHVRGEIKPHVKQEIDLNKLSRWDTVYAGDLHAHSNSQLNIVYPGSPLSTSYHRAPITNGVIILDSEDNSYEWIELQLPQLIRKTIDNSADAVKTDYDHTIYEIVGDMSELSTVDTDNNIIDKKIINKSSDASLNLVNMSISEELLLYLRKILKLPENTIDKVIGTHNDYIKDT